MITILVGKFLFSVNYFPLEFHYLAVFFLSLFFFLLSAFLTQANIEGGLGGISGQ